MSSINLLVQKLHRCFYIICKSCPHDLYPRPLFQVKVICWCGPKFQKQLSHQSKENLKAKKENFEVRQAQLCTKCSNVKFNRRLHLISHLSSLEKTIKRSFVIFLSYGKAYMNISSVPKLAVSTLTISSQ